VLVFRDVVEQDSVFLVSPGRRRGVESQLIVRETLESWKILLLLKIEIKMLLNNEKKEFAEYPSLVTRHNRIEYTSTSFILL
jgi:hypothetical protein